MARKIKSLSRILIFLIILAFLLPKNSNAASLIKMSDRMTRHAPLINSDHEIKFTTPSGIDNSGQYLRIIFDSGFDLANIDYTDIDFLHGPATGLELNENLASAADLTSWGISISGSSIDFMHPTDNANGDVAPGDKVIIRIGFNASGGDQQIVNPATTGSKIITLSGNYGDSGKLAVAIFEDQVGVGGDTSGVAPTPVILSPPINITTNKMDLIWTQNINSDFSSYKIYYSTSSGLDDLSGTLFTIIGTQTENTATITGLTANTTYYFKVYVFDTEGLKSASNEVSSKTGSSGTTLPFQPPTPTLDDFDCPVFRSPEYISGTRYPGTTVFVNFTNENVSYPTTTTWQSLLDFVMGSNSVNIFVQDNLGQTSNTLSAIIYRWDMGDTNGSGLIDDFDLAGIAWHWQSQWCKGDFNNDNIINDFDLAGLAAHWDNVY